MRRVEESNKAAAEQLQCNHARVPIFTPFLAPARSFDFAQDDRVSEMIDYAIYARVPTHKPYRTPARSFDFAQDDRKGGVPYRFY